MPLSAWPFPQHTRPFQGGSFKASDGFAAVAADRLTCLGSFAFKLQQPSCVGFRAAEQCCCASMHCPRVQSAVYEQLISATIRISDNTACQAPFQSGVASSFCIGIHIRAEVFRDADLWRSGAVLVHAYARRDLAMRLYAGTRIP